MPERKTILVIEDEQAIRETLQMALELEGYSVVTAKNGKEGLEAALQMPRPCLILLDLMMPVMDGWSFVDAQAKNNALAAIPVVVVTAFGNLAKSIKARKIIKKPVNIDDLYRAVRESCGSPVRS